MIQDLPLAVMRPACLKPASAMPSSATQQGKEST